LLKRSESPDPSGLKQGGNPHESGPNPRPNTRQAPFLIRLHPALPSFPLSPFCLFPSSTHSPRPEMRPCPSCQVFPHHTLPASRFTLHSSRNEKTNPIPPTPKPPQPLFYQALTPISRPATPEKTNRAPS